VVLSRSDARSAQKLHLEKQLGLFMVGKWEKRAQRFREIEESKWERKKKKTPVEEKEEIADKGEASSIPDKERHDRILALLERLGDLESSSVLLPSIAEEMVALSDYDGETHSRVGITGLNHAYFAEDHGTFRHKKQL
jgi:hypothetical protein